MIASRAGTYCAHSEGRAIARYANSYFWVNDSKDDTTRNIYRFAKKNGMYDTDIGKSNARDLIQMYVNETFDYLIPKFIKR